MRIKKSANTLKTHQLVRLRTGIGNWSWHEYQVHDVTGESENVPNQDTPIVWMELMEKNPGGLPQFVCLPLSSFGGRVMPKSKADKFWED